MPIGPGGGRIQVDWVTSIGRPAVGMPNTVVHAVTYAATDGGQAIGTVDHSPQGRFLSDELRAVTLQIIHA